MKSQLEIAGFFNWNNNMAMNTNDIFRTPLLETFSRDYDGDTFSTVTVGAQNPHYRTYTGREIDLNITRVVQPPGINVRYNPNATQNFNFAYINIGPRVYESRPVGNLEAIRHFRDEVIDTTPVLVHNRIPRNRNHFTPVHLRDLSPEQMIARRNFSIAKMSRIKRNTSMMLFKTCMVERTQYLRGKSFRFEIEYETGYWYVNGQKVITVDLRRGKFLEVKMPTPSMGETGPGCLNLARFLLRMFGIGAVRRKDKSVITTANATRSLASGESWLFDVNEIGSFLRPVVPMRNLRPSHDDPDFRRFIGQPDTPTTRASIQQEMDRYAANREITNRDPFRIFR